MQEQAPVNGGGNGKRGAETARFISASPAMRGLQRIVQDVAESDVPVLIVGEAGCGKRMVATQIHALSQRRAESFLEIPGSQLTSEMLRRAHAALQSAGECELSCGTLFIREIGDIAIAAQSHFVHMFFGSETFPNMPRLIASTRRNLEQEIHNGAFREDLYYRISSVCLRVPPLRHRREDIASLAESFLAKYSELFGRPKPNLAPSTWRFLLEHPWPENVRDLENAFKTLVAIEDERIALAALRSSALTGKSRNGRSERMSLKEAARVASREAERELILKVLSRTRWNRKRAAEELKISYKALLYKLKQIGLDEEVPGQEEVTV